MKRALPIVKRQDLEFGFPSPAERKSSEELFEQVVRIVEEREKDIVHNGQAPDPEDWKDRADFTADDFEMGMNGNQLEEDEDGDYDKSGEQEDD